MTGFWSGTGVVIGAAAALFIFLALFIGIVVWIFRPGSRREYDQQARLPLEDTPGNRNDNDAL